MEDGFTLRFRASVVTDTVARLPPDGFRSNRHGVELSYKVEAPARSFTL